jgi:hypothetical protein
MKQRVYVFAKRKNMTKSNENAGESGVFGAGDGCTPFCPKNKKLCDLGEFADALGSKCLNQLWQQW